MLENIASRCIVIALILSFYSCTEHSSDGRPVTNLPALSYTSTVRILGTEVPVSASPDKEPADAPKGMIYVQGGNVYLGNDNGLEEEMPRVWANVQPFFMDENEVTVAAFRKFLLATGHKTDADKFGNSGIFVNNADNWWTMKEGANWEYPQGKDKPKAKDDHPVTQVSWNDATAYATWAGKRLPSEVEWEHAARNAVNNQTRYPWGNEANVDGQWKLNIFQGSFPEKNENEDGYIYTSPVGTFGKTPLGLADIAGNVWEWCADSKINYKDLLEGDFNNPASDEKVIRGGSFLCETSRCHRYRVSSRSFTTKETSLMHIGFRCVKDVNG